VNWLVRIIAWRSNQSVIFRWSVVFGLFGFALAARYAMGFLHGGIPWLIFFPVLLIVTVLFGWMEGLVVLVLSVMAGVYLFLPPGMGLLPVGWVVVGGFSIGVVGALKAQAEEVVHANERQRLLFQEVQHRIANTLQSVVGVLDSANRKIDRTHAEAKSILEEGMRRIMASADIHRRLNDPKLFEQGLGSILTRSVATVIDANAISVEFNIEPFDLTFDQMSLITMLVIEFANNAQKHVFEPGLGDEFSVSLKATAEECAVLIVKDDGLGWSQTTSDAAGRTLGQTIIQNLADQLGGRLTIKANGGTEVSVMFPISNRNHKLKLTKEDRATVQAIKDGSSITGTGKIGG
jgi:two-component sensor histidine kinase